jgi:Fe-Mn family superoxide dismutase
MTHKLPDLPYDYSALEPHIDTRTMGVHHDKHHAAYVNNLNKALEGYPELQGKSTLQLLVDLDDVPEAIRTSVRNNGGGHAAHSMFWHCMHPKGGGEPGGSLADAIDESFGSFAGFKEAFGTAAATLFGSGWTWLCTDAEGKLGVTTTPGHDHPIFQGLAPLLVLDVWEHAYYLKFENRRADYIAEWWNVVDWAYVSANLTAVQVGTGFQHVADWASSSWGKIEEGWSKLVGA